MKGYIGMAVLALLVVAVWFQFARSGKELSNLQEKIELAYDAGLPDEDIAEMRVELSSAEGPRIFNGILLTFLSAGLVGIVFAVVVIPMLADRVTEAAYGSGAKLEADPLQSARVFMAQGEWEGAIKEFRKAAELDKTNRMPWTEIAKIKRVHQEDPAGAVEALKEGLEKHEWEVNDAAFLMFRISEIYEEDLADRGSAMGILTQVMEIFPETRHFKNARDKVQELESLI